jgi:hypothetical protein
LAGRGGNADNRDQRGWLGGSVHVRFVAAGKTLIGHNVGNVRNGSAFVLTDDRNELWLVPVDSLAILSHR